MAHPSYGEIFFDDAFSLDTSDHLHSNSGLRILNAGSDVSLPAVTFRHIICS